MNTRPDISTAVHQCSRYTACPNLVHEDTVKRISRYLKRTSNQDIRIKPDKTQTTLDCYVDEDFACNWNKENSHQPASVVSRTGLCIRYFGWPVLWASKLQTEISLSTTEAEYIALSTAMRYIIPMKDLLLNVKRFWTFHQKQFTVTPLYLKIIWEPRNFLMPPKWDLGQSILP